MAALSPGAIAVDVARQFEISTRLIYKWRSEAMAMAVRRTGEFVPAVIVEDPPEMKAAGLPAPAIFVELAGWGAGDDQRVGAGVGGQCDATSPCGDPGSIECLGVDRHRVTRTFAERGVNGQSAEQRRAVRQELSALLVADLEVYMREQCAKLSRGHDLAKAMNYMLKRWPSFIRLLLMPE